MLFIIYFIYYITFTLTYFHLITLIYSNVCQSHSLSYSIFIQLSSIFCLFTLKMNKNSLINYFTIHIKKCYTGFVIFLFSFDCIVYLTQLINVEYILPHVILAVVNQVNHRYCMFIFFMIQTIKKLTHGCAQFCLSNIFPPFSLFIFSHFYLSFL